METVDLCVALSSPNVANLWPMFWSSLTKHMDLKGVKLHLVNKDVSRSVMRSVVETIGNDVTCAVHDLPFITGEHASTVVDDVAYTCNYMVESCGNADWICISHFDVFFKGD